MESNDLKALSELYLKTVYEAKAESPEEEEEKDKEDDDLAGSPNKNGKKNGKKAKRWWDDDGDGKGYEKGEVDGKFPDKDSSKKKKVKEEVELDEAERKLADRLARKRKLYDKTTKKAMQFARDEGEASGHARYRMSSISREMDGIKAKMNKEEVEIEEKKMVKVKLNPKKKIGVKVIDIGPGGKEVVRKNTMDEAVYGGKKEAPKDNRMVLTRADKKANTPAWQNRDKKNPKTGESIYKKADHLKNEEVEVDESIGSAIDKTLGAAGEVADTAIKLPAKGIGYLKGLKKGMKKAAKKGEDKAAGDAGPKNEELDPGMEHNLSVLRMLAEKEVNVKDTKKVVDAIRAYDKSKDASRDATDDSDKGDKEGAAIEKKYAAKERGEIKKDDPNWKNKKYHTGMHGEEVESLVASGKFSNEELMSIANLQEADIADILARLEKKRISKGGDPDESPLGKKTGRAMKSQQDKARKKAGLKTEDYWNEFEESREYSHNPEKYHDSEGHDKKLERDKPYRKRSKAARMADPERGINSPAFRKFMADRGM